MPKHLLTSSAVFAALALWLAACVAAPPALAQPTKPKPPVSDSRPDDDTETPDGAAAGKKVKTEVEKAESGKAKPKAAEPADDETRPATAGAAAKPTRGP